MRALAIRCVPEPLRLVDALVDFPFALPTAVAGITLTTLYAPNGWLGAPLARLGIKAAFTPLGITLALTFIGLPFVVRTLQPVLESKQIADAEIAPGASLKGYLYFPAAAYQRARIELFDVDGEESEGFSVDF